VTELPNNKPGRGTLSAPVPGSTEGEVGMSSPYTTEADVLADGYTKMTTTENGVTRYRYEKIIDGHVIEHSVSSTANIVAASRASATIAARARERSALQRH
jgi:hypothetical protein